MKGTDEYQVEDSGGKSWLTLLEAVDMAPTVCLRDCFRDSDEFMIEDSRGKSWLALQGLGCVWG